MTPYRTLILTPPITIEFKYWLPEVGAVHEGLGHDSQDKSNAR